LHCSSVAGKADVRFWRGLLGCECRVLTPQEMAIRTAMVRDEDEGDMSRIHAVAGMPEISVVQGLTCGCLYEHGTRVTPFALGFTSMFMDVPCKALMWAYTLNYMWVRSGRQVTLRDVSCFFPGAPTDDAYSRRWAWLRDEEAPDGNRMAAQDFWPRPEHRGYLLMEGRLN